MNELVGVILAAGRGRRLGTLGEVYVKALLPVANEPIIAHHLRLFHRLGVRAVVVVVGHHADQLRRELGNGDQYGLSLEFVQQATALGSAHALASVRHRVRGPFLLTLGDYYFVPEDPEVMIRRLDRGESAIATKREPSALLLREACAVEVGADRRVVSIVEKPSKPATDLKGCGFYALVPEAFDAISRTPRSALRDEYELTDSLDLLVRSGRPLFSEEIIRWDNNVTRPDDLLQCNLEWLARNNLNQLADPESFVDPGTEMEKVILGRGTSVKGLSRLEEVVAFPGSDFEDSGALERALLTPQGPVFCGEVTQPAST